MIEQTSSRRRFLKTTAGAAMAAPWFAKYSGAAEAKVLRHAAVGCSGQSWSDLNSLATSDRWKLVAAADVDTNNFKRIQDRFPGVRVYQDWREMFDKEKDNIDAVNVSTPDHMHAPVGMAAMDLGKHVYGQKPLAHEVGECRAMAKKAAETGVVTQMGTQIASTFSNRFTVHFIQSGAIGKVVEAHVFSNKQWGGPMTLPDREDPVPENLDWNLWCGVGEKAQYQKGNYHPGQWRKRRRFGTSTLGDMGCHIIHPVFMGMGLTAPLTVRGEGEAPTDVSWAPDGEAHYVFPGNEYSEGDTVAFHWTHGNRRPKLPDGLKLAKALPGQGSVVIGTKGVLISPHMATPYLNSGERLDYPKFEPKDHYRDWVTACLDGGETLCNFDYAAKVTESILLGNIGVVFPGKELEWDAANLAFKNSDEATKLVSVEYRKY